MDGNSSLDLLIDINQAERQLQLAHFDSLDNKAGLVLGFAGVLIALGNGSGNLPGAVSTILAALAAVASVASFWPRKFASIDPTRLGNYAGAELGFTQLTCPRHLGSHAGGDDREAGAEVPSTEVGIGESDHGRH